MKYATCICLAIVLVMAGGFSAFAAQGALPGKDDLLTMDAATQLVLEENPAFSILSARLQMFDGRRVWAVKAIRTESLTRSSYTYNPWGSNSVTDTTYTKCTIYEYYIGAADKVLYSFGHYDFETPGASALPRGLAAAKKTALGQAAGTLLGYEICADIGAEYNSYLMEILSGSTLHIVKVSGDGAKVLRHMQYQVSANASTLVWDSLQTAPGELTEAKAAEAALARSRSEAAGSKEEDVVFHTKDAKVDECRLVDWGGDKAWEVRVLMPATDSTYLGKDDNGKERYAKTELTVCHEMYVTMSGVTMGLREANYKRFILPKPVEFVPDRNAGLQRYYDQMFKNA